MMMLTRQKMRIKYCQESVRQWGAFEDYEPIWGDKIPDLSQCRGPRPEKECKKVTTIIISITMVLIMTVPGQASFENRGTRLTRAKRTLRRSNSTLSQSGGQDDDWQRWYLQFWLFTALEIIRSFSDLPPTSVLVKVKNCAWLMPTGLRWFGFLPL